MVYYWVAKMSMKLLELQGGVHHKGEGSSGEHFPVRTKMDAWCH